VGFMVDKVALGQVSSGYFGFPCQLSFHQMIHAYLSSGAGTTGQLVTDVPSSLTLIPPHESKLNYTRHFILSRLFSWVVRSHEIRILHSLVAVVASTWSVCSNRSLLENYFAIGVQYYQPYSAKKQEYIETTNNQSICKKLKSLSFTDYTMELKHESPIPK
jgi:hypothetical protein